MKMILYKTDLRLNPQDEHAVISKAAIPYSPENEAYAKRHSVDGTCTVENWNCKIPAPCNLLAGEYAAIDGVLYLATGNIPDGEPVIPGQNAVKTSVEQQLYQLKGA